MKAFTAGIVTAISLSLLSSIAHANGSGSGKVTRIGGQFTSGNYPAAVYFGISPAPTGRAACSSNGSYQFVFDPGTPEGKALYSALMMTLATDRSINIYGTGSCVLGQPMEGVSFWSLDP